MLWEEFFDSILIKMITHYYRILYIFTINLLQFKLKFFITLRVIFNLWKLLLFRFLFITIISHQCRYDSIIIILFLFICVKLFFYHWFVYDYSRITCIISVNDSTIVLSLRWEHTTLFYHFVHLWVYKFIILEVIYVIVAIGIVILLLSRLSHSISIVTIVNKLVLFHHVVIIIKWDQLIELFSMFLYWFL